jgi:hypothetical protein
MHLDIILPGVRGRVYKIYIMEGEDIYLYIEDGGGQYGSTWIYIFWIHRRHRHLPIVMLNRSVRSVLGCQEIG